MNKSEIFKVCQILLGEYSNKLSDLFLQKKTHNDNLAYVTTNEKSIIVINEPMF